MVSFLITCKVHWFDSFVSNGLFLDRIIVKFNLEIIYADKDACLHEVSFCMQVKYWFDSTLEQNFDET